MVAGYRKVRKDSLSRRIGSFMTNYVIYLINGLRMKDYGSMLRVFKKDAARAMVSEYMKSEGYITMLIAKITRNVAEVEVRHDERYAGSSKYNMRKLLPLFYKIVFYYDDRVRRLVTKGAQVSPYMIERKVEHGKEVILSGKSG
jgi:undecaprenyl-phosphate 4-deoxy-4-formamido-L-arabinose transferase